MVNTEDMGRSEEEDEEDTGAHSPGQETYRQHPEAAWAVLEDEDTSQRQEVVTEAAPRLTEAV